MKSIYETERIAALDAGMDLKDSEIRDWLVFCLAKDQRAKYTPTVTTRRLQNDDDRSTALRYATRMIEELRDCPPGNRNNQLNTTAFGVGRTVAGGFLGEEEARQNIVLAARCAGLTDSEIEATATSGFAAGIAAGWDNE